eukprot:g78627.t1
MTRQVTYQTVDTYSDRYFVIIIILKYITVPCLCIFHKIELVRSQNKLGGSEVTESIVSIIDGFCADMLQDLRII